MNKINTSVNYIPVAEIFGPTIQGEGSEVGVKTLFLRVAGCDFKCSWCDSKFTWKITSTTKKYLDTELVDILIQKCKETSTRHIVITGGNPCLYDLDYLISNLISKNIKVDIETQGSILPKWLTKVSTLVISPKAPSSGMKDVYPILDDWFNSNTHLPPVVIKIPIFNDLDFTFAEKYYSLVQKYVSKYNIKFYLSVGNNDVTEEGNISSKLLKSYSWLIDKVMISSMEDVYVLPQIHTLVWGNKRGV